MKGVFLFGSMWSDEMGERCLKTELRVSGGVGVGADVFQFSVVRRYSEKVLKFYFIYKKGAKSVNDSV